MEAVTAINQGTYYGTKSVVPRRVEAWELGTFWDKAATGRYVWEVADKKNYLMGQVGSLSIHQK